MFRAVPGQKKRPNVDFLRSQAVNLHEINLIAQPFGKTASGFYEGFGPTEPVDFLSADDNGTHDDQLIELYYVHARIGKFTVVHANEIV